MTRIPRKPIGADAAAATRAAIKEAVPQAVEAAAVHTAKAGNGTVAVACKFPNGIVLQLSRRVDYVEEGSGGMRINRHRFDKIGPRYRVDGPAVPNGQRPKGYQEPDEIRGGYAITFNIPQDFFEAWMAENKDNPLVTNGMIFAHTTRDATVGQAKEQEELRSGFEPLTPDTDNRMPKSLNPMVGKIETAQPGAA